MSLRNIDDPLPIAQPVTMQQVRSARITVAEQNDEPAMRARLLDMLGLGADLPVVWEDR